MSLFRAGLRNVCKCPEMSTFSNSEVPASPVSPDAPTRFLGQSDETQNTSGPFMRGGCNRRLSQLAALRFRKRKSNAALIGKSPTVKTLDREVGQFEIP
jgi:hypothetical protein